MGAAGQFRVLAYLLHLLSAERQASGKTKRDANDQIKTFSAFYFSILD